VNSYLYSYCYGECGPDYWHSWPILKITPKRIILGGWHYGEHHLDRQKVEAGDCHRPEMMYTEEQKRAKDPEGKLEIIPVPYDPDKFAPKPESEPTPEQLEFAKTFAEDWFSKHPDGKPSDCSRELVTKHDMPGTIHLHVLKWGFHKKKAVPMTDGFFALLGGFVNAVQVVINKTANALEMPAPQVQYDDGPIWVRICLSRSELDNSVYCFVRKPDGAIFVADGWKRPRIKTGVVGFLHDYAPDLLKGNGPCPQNGKRYLQGRQP
jgi:hypothetical protein